MILVFWEWVNGYLIPSVFLSIRNMKFSIKSHDIETLLYHALEKLYSRYLRYPIFLSAWNIEDTKVISKQIEKNIVLSVYVSSDYRWVLYDDNFWTNTFWQMNSCVKTVLMKWIHGKILWAVDSISFDLACNLSKSTVINRDIQLTVSI